MLPPAAGPVVAGGMVFVPPAPVAVVAEEFVFALPAEDAWGEFALVSLPPPPHAAKPIANKH